MVLKLLYEKVVEIILYYNVSVLYNVEKTINTKPWIIDTANPKIINKFCNINTIIIL